MERSFVYVTWRYNKRIHAHFIKNSWIQEYESILMAKEELEAKTNLYKASQTVRKYAKNTREEQGLLILINQLKHN